MGRLQVQKKQFHTQKLPVKSTCVANWDKDNRQVIGLKQRRGVHILKWPSHVCVSNLFEEQDPYLCEVEAVWTLI